MAKFKPYDYRQTSMVVINYEDQLQPGTFEHAIHHLVDKKLDLTIFHPHYQNDDAGRPAYDPAILLKIILFAYSKGITSNREIQWCCETNILFKALSCDTVPHFTTIASFVSSFPRQIEQLFEQILLICHEQGLLGNELFAIDGCKMSSNAAKEWSGTFKELEQKRQKIKRQIRRCLKEHRQLDEQDPTNSERIRRTQQTLETLDRAATRIDQFLKTQSPRMGQGKRPKEVKSNITDNESAKMTTSKGTIQGYNGVATVDKKHQIVVDAQRSPKAPTFGGHGQEHHTLQPVLDALKGCYRRLGIRKAADHRKGAGRQVSFQLEGKRKPTYTDWMKHRVDGGHGKQVYSHRMSTVEPVFGNIVTNKGLSQFSLRGRDKVQGQWRLYCMVHNIEKMKNYEDMRI